MGRHCDGWISDIHTTDELRVDQPVTDTTPCGAELTVAVSSSWFVDRVRALLTTPLALRRLNISSGALLIGVGLALPVI